jgi:hypothetical protein
MISISKWLTRWFSLVTLLIAFTFGFNGLIDSMGLATNDGYLDRAAQDLSGGKIIGGLRNIDDRSFVRRVIGELKPAPDWIVLGSSRSMQVRKRHFLSSEINFHNYSVAGASLEDFLALVSIHLDAHGKLPAHAIVSVDPWMFNRNSGLHRYHSLADDYEKMMKRLGLPIQKELGSRNNLLKLISLDYMSRNINFVIDNLRNEMWGYVVISNSDVDMHLKEPDGSAHYPFSQRRPDPKAVELLAIGYARGNAYALGQFTQMGNRELFEAFIGYMLDHQVEVTLLLMPYHPTTYKLLLADSNHRIVSDVESYLVGLSNSLDLKLIGSYDPRQLGFGADDFFDGSHSLEPVSKSLLEGLQSSM